MAGSRPGTHGHDQRGLKVEYAAVVEEIGNHGYGKKTGIFRPAGWYVWVQIRRGSRQTWEAVLPLRFIRQIDAQRACHALVAAGLDSAKRMKAAGGETVIRTAFEALAW